MSENSGYIPLSRKFFEHELWLEPRVFSRAEAFADLLRRVRVEANTGSILIGAQSITIERGEVAASIRFLAKNWGWSKNKVDKFLDYLVANGMITRRKPYEMDSGTRKGTATRTAPTIIKLCSFDKYNPIIKKLGHEPGHEPGHERDTKGTSINNKEKTNSNELVQKKAAAIAATNERKEKFRLSLVPYVPVYGREMIREFFDYWTEKSRTGTRMRFEQQTTWETPLRLKTWAKRKEEKNSAKKEENEPLRTGIEPIGRPERRTSTL